MVSYLGAADPELRGFTNPFRIEYTPVNVGALAALPGDEVTPAILIAAGLLRPKSLVKILGQGEIGRPLKVAAHAFSGSAEAAITGAGGSVERVPSSFGNGRPPARGNALMNR